MKLSALCALLCWGMCSAVSAQVSVVCRTPEDRVLADTLARLIARPVTALEAGAQNASAGQEVTIDRAAATVRVYSVAQRTTLSRVLDADVMNSSTYAVALAAAELLEFATARPSPPRAAAQSGAGPRLGLAAELELQSQPGFDLWFVRPAVQVELAWGRERPGAFWTVGLRGAGPGARTLRAPNSARLEALSADAAAQLTLGHALGRLALLSGLAVGVSYLNIAAFDAGGARLGRDRQLSPLFAAGLGFRYSVLFGFALCVRGELQWAGAPALYRIAGEQVLEAGALRVSLLAGVVWEAALAHAP